MSVKSMVLRVAKIEHFIVSLYTIKRKRNIFKIYAYMIVKSMGLEKYKKWLIYSFSTNSILMMKRNYAHRMRIIRFQKLLWGIFFDDLYSLPY